MSLPSVSIVVPTYNRHRFIDQLMRCVRIQDYPHDLIEVIILDDSETPLIVPPILPQETFQLKVVYSPIKLTLGEKRNRLNQLATGDIIIPFDDDDYYPPQRVSHAVEQLKLSGMQLAGSSLSFMWFPQSNIIYLSGPYGENHSCNNAMAYTQAYAKSHAYDARLSSGEERSFTRIFREPMVQLNPACTMLSIAHSHNTVPKPEKNLQNCKMPNLEKFPQFSQQSWLDFVSDIESQNFYQAMFHLDSIIRV